MEPRVPRENGPPGLRFALVTPSYYVDLEQCRWLCETVARYVPPEIPHYLVVDRADRDIFAPLLSPRTKLVLKEDVLRGRLRQLPFARRWWLSPRGFPVRGWIVQQLTKLFVHEVVDEDVFVFVDSGAFFVRPYDPRKTLRGDLVPLFCEHGEYFRGEETRRWHRVGAKLLGIQPLASNDAGYIKTLVTWRRDNLAQMHAHMERVGGRPAFHSLARQLTLSEYYLYGMYCDLILGDRARQYHTDITETLSHWGRETLSVVQLRELRKRLSPEHLLVMINEKSRTPLAAIREAFAGD